MTQEELNAIIAKCAADTVGPLVQSAVTAEMEKFTKAVPQKLPESGGIELIHSGGSLMKTKNGSIINTKGGIDPKTGKSNGVYWHKLSPEMEEWAKNFAANIKDMTVANNTSGGFLVPEEFEASIIQYQEPTNIVWPRATIVPMSTDLLRWPKLGQVSTGTVDHFAGIVFNWTEEANPKTETEPKWESFNLQAKEISGFTQISDTLLADSPINLVNFLTDLFRRAWMWITDKVYIDGDGAGKPMGVLTDPNVIHVARGAANTVTLTDISNMYAQHPSHFMNGAIWFMNKVIMAGLLNERSTTNDLLLRNMISIKDGNIEAIKGHPVALSDNKTPAIGTKGDVILGNWREGYYIGRRQNMTVAKSEHYAFINNMTTLRVTGRVAGNVAQPKAFVVLDVTAGGS